MQLCAVGNAFFGSVLNIVFIIGLRKGKFFDKRKKDIQGIKKISSYKISEALLFLNVEKLTAEK